MVSSCDPHSLKAGKESHAFRYWKKRWADKSHCTACQLPFFELKMLPWSPEQSFFFPDIDIDIAPKGQNGPWKPLFSCQQPLLCLHLNQLFGPHSLLLVGPLLISSQPIQSSKGPLSLPHLGCTTIKFERKEFKHRINRKNDPSLIYYRVHVDYISFSQKV